MASTVAIISNTPLAISLAKKAFRRAFIGSPYLSHLNIQAGLRDARFSRHKPRDDHLTIHHLNFRLINLNNK